MDKLNEDFASLEEELSFLGLREKLSKEVDCKVSYLDILKSYIIEEMKGLEEQSSLWILIKQSGALTQEVVNGKDIERYLNVNHFIGLGAYNLFSF